MSFRRTQDLGHLLVADVDGLDRHEVGSLHVNIRRRRMPSPNGSHVLTAYSSDTRLTLPMSFERHYKAFRAGPTERLAGRDCDITFTGIRIESAPARSRLNR